MLLNPVLPETSATGGGGGGGGAAHELINESIQEEEEDLRNPSSFNQWPNEETSALLKIRSQMNHAFNEAQHQSPLWDEISRKMGEIGYYKCAKNCKEKFENIYTDSRGTKEAQSDRENRNHQFFEQLEVFDNQYSAPADSTNKFQTLIAEAEMTIPSTSVTSKATWASQDSTIPQDCNVEFMSTYTSSKSLPERGSEGSIRKKRKLTNYIEKMMNNVFEKQQDLQNKFLEAIEKYEKDRLAREEVWKTQEMARIKKEQELIAQERTLVAAKDAAVIAFLQKIYGQEVQLPFTMMGPLNSRQEVQEPCTTMVPLSGRQEEYAKLFAGSKETSVNLPKRGVGGRVNAGEHFTQGSSSRWPKEEVEALFRLRTNSDLHENGPKGGGGTLWEEISSEMKNLGYDRSSKKCKEKWENMNKYYRRLKEANKKRPEDSKACPYFNLLESLYENRSKRLEHTSYSSGCNMRPEYILMQMMTQEQHQLQEPQQSLTEHGKTHIYHGQGSN